MDLEEFKDLCILTRNEIVSKNNSMNINYELIDKKLNYLKKKGKTLTREIVSLVLVISLVGGSATFIGLNTKRERKFNLDNGVYSIEEFNNKRKVDYLTAYFGYVLLLVVLYSGLCYVKGNSIFKDFIIKLRNNIKDYREGLESGCVLFADMKNDIMFLISYIAQYEECKRCFDVILKENPYLEGDALINKIDDVLNNLDINSIINNINVKKKILG